MNKKALKNWWYYHKWYVICGAVLIWILGDVACSALGLWQKKPDLEIAYVGSSSLPDDTISALENAFAELGGDFNRDGSAVVQINQYIMNSRDSAPAISPYGYASEVALMGDISAGESYFFLTDDPESLQRGFQILAGPDGSCPDDSDYSVGDKVILWKDASALTGMELGSYTAGTAGNTVSGDSQELLGELYLGRRCFYTDKTSDYVSQCNELWNTIISTANVQK